MPLPHTALPPDDEDELEDDEPDGEPPEDADDDKVEEEPPEPVSPSLWAQATGPSITVSAAKTVRLWVFMVSLGAGKL
jgi:hypothetical protein